MKSLFSKLTSFMSGNASPTEPNESSPNSEPAGQPFVPNNELESLLVAAANDPSARREFNRALLSENLLVATPEQPDEEGHRTLEKDEVLSILNVGRSDGPPLPAIFSSEQRLAECFGAGAGYVAMQGAILLEIVQKEGAVLNPESAYGVVWSSENLAAILGRAVRRTVQKDTQISLGIPVHRPEQLITELTRALKDDERIQEAWLALAHWPDSDEWSWYLDIRSNSPSDEISPSLAEACHPDFQERKPIDIVVNSPMESAGTGIRLKPATNH